MVKQYHAKHIILLTGKGTEIKKSLYALLQSNNSKTTVAKYLNYCSNRSVR